MRREIGEDCAATIARRPARARAPGRGDDRAPASGARAACAASEPRGASDRWHRTTKRIGARGGAPPRARRAAPPAPAAFQRRRELNVERLNRADCVIAMSHRVAEIYARLGVERDRLRTIHLTLAHIERLTPRRRPARAGGR